MPLSKQRDKIRMRRLRAQQALLGDKDGLRRRLGEAQRALEAKTARVEWQSGGIRMLHDRVATLEALLATQPAMADTEVWKALSAEQQRNTQLEADMARLEMMFTRQSLDDGGMDLPAKAPASADSMLREGELM